MQRPHVLTSITLPRQRLGVTENALVIPFLVGSILLLFSHIMVTLLGWLIAHFLMMLICHLEPHVIDLIRARRVPRTRRQLKNGGNIYGA